MTSYLQRPARLGLTRAQVEAVGAAAERLASATAAISVYLVGDRARGQADEDDVWELLVVLPDDVEWGRWTPLTLWPLVAGGPLSFEVKAVKATTFAADKDGPNGVAAEAAQDGLRLYARHPHVDGMSEEEIEAEAVRICRRADAERRAGLGTQQADLFRQWALQRPAIRAAWKTGSRVVVLADPVPDDWERRVWAFDLAKALKDDDIDVELGERDGLEVYRREAAMAEWRRDMQEIYDLHAEIEAAPPDG